MKNRIKSIPNWARNSIYTITLTVIGGLTVEYTKEYPIPGAISSFICWIWSKFVGLINIEIKLWLVLVLIGVIVLVKYAINNIEINPVSATNHNQGKVSKPKILSYTSEYYKGILWTFSWELYNNKWSLINLTPCCPKDKTPLDYCQCPRCDADYFGKGGLDSNKAEILIIDNAKRLLQDNPQHL